MNLMNYHLYANAAAMPQIMAEDAGAPELRNPAFYLRTKLRTGWTDRLRDRLARRRENRLERLSECAHSLHAGVQC